MTVLKNECSGCGGDFAIDTDTFVITMTVPSNGRRGQGHVSAHQVTADGYSDGTLIMWECPICEYSDSVYQDADVRKELT